MNHTENTREVEQNCRCSDLSEIREYPRIDREMSVGEGMAITIHRLGLSVPKVHRMCRDRYPVENHSMITGNLDRFRIRCFLKFDLIFSDILHVSQMELHHIGLGRRYVINRLLRIVLSGLCDHLDRSGLSGDFPPRSWLSEEKAKKIATIQTECLMKMKHEKAELLQSIKVRLRRISTYVLTELIEYGSLIRKEVCKAEKETGKGLERFSDFLTEFRISFDRTHRKKEIYSRRRARLKRRLDGYTWIRSVPYYNFTKKLEKKIKRQKSQRAWINLRRSLTDLKRHLDPDQPSWYRRPTDFDWSEGLRSDQRKPRLLYRKGWMKRYGFGTVPGLNKQIEAKDWFTLRTDYTIDEVRNLNKEDPKSTKDSSEIISNQ